MLGSRCGGTIPVLALMVLSQFNGRNILIIFWFFVFTASLRLRMVTHLGNLLKVMKLCGHLIRGHVDEPIAMTFLETICE
jgi:hypothetical protein